MFAFRNQPLKFLYLAFWIPSLLFLRLPYWAAIASIPALRPRRSWTFRRTLTVRFSDAYLRMLWAIGLASKPAPIADGETDASGRTAASSSSSSDPGLVWVDAVGEDMLHGDVASVAKLNNVSPAKVYGYWYGELGQDGRPGQRAGKDEKVLLHFRGNGYIMSAMNRNIGSMIPSSILDCSSAIRRAFCPECRLSSAAPYPKANPFPAALIDALSAYHYLINTLGFSPSNVVLSGDSAGGHLALSLVRYLVLSASESNNPSTPGVPRALILLSPTCDWGGTHDGAPSSAMTRNARSDYVSVILNSRYVPRALLGNLPSSDAVTNAWISPASLRIPHPDGLFGGFPATFIAAGGAEVTLDGMRTLRDRVVQDNGDGRVRYLEYVDATHDFVGLEWHQPERGDALGELKKWLEEVLVE